MDVGEPNANGSSSYAPEVLPPESHDDGMTHHTPRLCTVIPNRIFVGGIDHKVSESDLRHIFSQRGPIKEVKIVVDRSGMSKGYGFVTFQTEDDALKVLNDVNGIHLKDKKLSIAQAFRKQQASGQTMSTSVASPDSTVPLPMSCGTLFQTTCTGSLYTFQNGMAYFHCPGMNQLPHHWPPAPPVMHPQVQQPVYQQPASHHYQCVPNQYQWNVTQSLVPSGPVYPQPSDYLYQPTNGGSVQPPPPVMENTTPEFIEPTVQQVYPLYPQRAERMRPIVLQHDPGKNQTFPHLHVHLQPKYRRRFNHKDYRCLPEATEPPDASVLHSPVD